MNIEIIPFAQGEALLGWLALTDALEAGHVLPKAEIADTFLYRGEDTLLTRSAWIDGLGLTVKAATVFPENARFNLPNINGGVSLFSDADGTLEAVIDFHLVTKWKTSGDSLLAARKLARPDSEHILIVGAGNVGCAMREAYGALFPNARFSVWSRTRATAERFVARYPDVTIAKDLKSAVQAADIVTTATLTKEPIIRGDWLRPGQHIDLVGAFRPDMREADDRAMQRARVFVDSRDTTLGHIGELMIPLANGAVRTSHVLADFYDLPSGDFRRESDDEITLFKNGGGAHLDLMTSRYVLNAWNSR